MDECGHETRRLERPVAAGQPFAQQEEAGGSRCVRLGSGIGLGEQPAEQELVGAGRAVGERPVSIGNQADRIGRIGDVECGGDDRAELRSDIPGDRGDRAPGDRGSACRATEP